MLDNIVRVNEYNISIYNNEEINVVLLGDLHFCDSFKESKLNKLAKKMQIISPDYICIAGDIIDNTNFLEYNKDKKIKLLKWLKYLGREYKVFITLGNHDLSKHTNKGWKNDEKNKFWEEVSLLEGVYLSRYVQKYEDDKVIIFLNAPAYAYYYNENKIESKDFLISQLKKYKESLVNLSENKLKIFLTHSPILMDDLEILELIKEFDFILCGHMHNGMVPIGIDKLIKNNRGIIAPNKKMFPQNARGLKEIEYNLKKIYLLTSSGITKLSECSGLFRFFNCLYYMDIDSININKKRKII